MPRWWAASFLVVPTLLVVGYVLNPFGWHSSYITREFTMSERLASQSVALWTYLEHMLLLRTQGLGLFHDDFAILNWSSVKPWAGLVAMVGCLAVATMLRRRYPELLFAITWFLLGHTVESAVIPLEIYFEHRNYLPMVGLLAGLSFFVVRLFVQHIEDARLIASVTGVAIVGMASVLLLSLTVLWSNPYLKLQVWHLEHPQSPRAWRAVTHMIGHVQSPQQGRRLAGIAAERFPDDPSFPLMEALLACRDDPRKAPGQQRQTDWADGGYRLGDGTLPIARELADAYLHGQCDHASVPLSGLLQSAPTMQAAQKNPNALLGLLHLRADVQLHNGQFYAAVESLLLADSVTKNPVTSLRLAHMMLRIGNVETAMEWIQNAERQSAARRAWWLGPDPAIAVLKSRTQSLMTDATPAP